MTNQNIRPITRIEGLYASLGRALQLHAAGKVHPAEGQARSFIVETPGGYYLVIDGICACPEATQESDLLQGYCQHQLAVELHKEAEARKAGPANHG